MKIAALKQMVVSHSNINIIAKYSNYIFNVVYA